MSVTKKLITGVLLLAFFLVPINTVYSQSLGQEITGQIEAGANKAELGKADNAQEVVASFIQLILTLVGTIFLVLIVIAGYNLLTARGEEDKVEKANKTIKAAMIGLIITLAAYSITLFVGERTQKALTPGAIEAEEEAANDGLKWSDL